MSTKLEKIRSSLKENGIDALIVLNELNQRYLSDFAFTDGLLFITHNHAELITDFRYYEMAKNNADKQYNVVTPENRYEYISSIISDDSVKSIGFEGGYVSYEVYHRYCEKYPGIEFVDIGALIENIREIKSEEEVALMQKAQDITDKAFTHIINTITPNMTEIEVAAELEYVMRKSGADGLAFDTIAVSGTSSALPHGTPENKKLSRGFLTMDYGAKYRGYCSDMTRTIVIGRADAEIKKLYNTVLEAQLAALKYIRVGADLAETDRIARDIIDSNEEYKGAFGHSLGHSVGLFIHESPRLSKVSVNRKMRAGEIYTVEPGIYLYGKYGCRIEDMVAVREDGLYNFTHSTKDLIEIL